MHGWISCTTFEHFSGVLIEQQTYAIQNFRVEPYTCQNKCFDSSKHIILSEATEVVHLPGYHCEIADSIFRFTNLKRIQEFKVDNNYLIGNSSTTYFFILYLYTRDLLFSLLATVTDIVGIVDSAKSIEICTKSNGEEGCFMDVSITDLV